MTETIAAAQGHWREILPILGLPEKALNGRNQPCPMCGGKDRFRFTDRSGDGDYICNQCGAGKGAQLLMKFNRWSFKQVFDEIDRIVGNLPPPQINGKQTSFRSADELNLIWRSARPITATDAAGRYLANRGLVLDRLDLRALRVTVLPHRPSGTRALPCMVACLSDQTGKPKQIHRTYLSPDGCKADVDPVRMFMPVKLPIGGAIRLGAAADTMGVAEGIETALSASILARMPVWATTSDRMLMQWQPPVEATRITVFGDNDMSYAGQAAAYALAKRLVSEAQRDRIERKVNVEIAPRMGGDWNDVLKEKAR